MTVDELWDNAIAAVGDTDKPVEHSQLKIARAGHVNARAIVQNVYNNENECPSCGPLDDCPGVTPDRLARRDAVRALADVICERGAEGRIKMNESTEYENGLAVFTIESEEWVVAKDESDAESVWSENGMDPMDFGEGPVAWTRCDPSKKINWREDESEAGVPTTYADLAKRGRGYLGSANH